MAKSERALTIQMFRPCTSLISIKLNLSNYLLWKSQILPLIRNMGIEAHLQNHCPPEEELTDTTRKISPNPKYQEWMNNDGLLTSWLLGTISEERLAMLDGTDNAHPVWKSPEEQL